MSRRQSETEISQLRRIARACADERRETLSTVHLLAAVWRCGGPARELLEARRLDEASLLKAARSFDETHDDLVEDVLQAAREVARRAAVPSRKPYAAGRRGAAPGLEDAPGGIHVLVVLASHRQFAAYRALVQRGVDVARLRTAATRIALGVVQPPRERKAEALPEAVTTTEPRAKPRGPSRAVRVPLIPPLKTKHPGARKEPTPPPPAVAAPTEAPVESMPEAGSSPGEDAVDQEAAPVSEERPTGALAELGENLTELAREDQLPPVVGREPEIEQVLDILAKRHANAALLVGPAGVGKTSVARGIAHHWAKTGEADLVEVEVGALVAGTVTRGSLADRIASLRDEVVGAERRTVLFVDEIHELLASDEGVTEIKTALARGDLSLVGACTIESYRRIIEPDAALARRFTVVEVAEPNEADAFLLLQAVCDDLGAHHGVRFSDEAIATAVSWSIRYLPGRALPDKAVAVLDLAGARLARRGEDDEVAPEHVAAVVAEHADVPIERLLETDHERMRNLHQLLAQRVVGHDAACERIAAVLRRNAAGLRGRRPIGSFLLLGPTGVGKTETAKAIAEALFHAPEAMTRLDMSEYSEAHSVARLIGAPPGYVGHEAGGLLTEAVRKRPYQVLLLDEIEKAHRDVLQCFLQVFDEGRMTDGRGATIDFCHCVIVLTSNLGADAMRGAMNERRVGFGRPAGASGADLEGVAIGAARGRLPPELYNRIDEVLFFRPLDDGHVRRIAKRLLARLHDQLALRGVELQVEDAAYDALLAQGGYDPELGARPMRRAVQRLVEAPLADLILAGELEQGVTVRVDVDGDGGLRVEAARRRAS